MILFGHLGLTYAAAAVIEKAAIGDRLKKANKHIDYRLVLIGSILPDIIDKLAINLFGDGSLHSGRIFAHSMLIVLLISGAGLLLWKKSKKLWLATLGLCSLVHLLLDSMWLYPNILFWPFYDLFRLRTGDSLFSGFYKILERDFYSVSIISIWDTLKNPLIGIPELIGLVIILRLFIRLIAKKQLTVFIRTGKTGI